MSTADDVPEPPPRSSFRLIGDPLLGPFMLGKLLSAIGMWIHNVVAVILAYELTGSTFVVGLVSVVQFVPQLVLASWSGALADRRDRRTQVIVGRAVCAAGSAGLAVWLWLAEPGGGEDDAVALIVTAGVLGLGAVIGGPAMHAILPSLVRPAELRSAVTLSVVPIPIARAAGPVIGALIATTIGPPVAFCVAAVCNLVFVAILARTRPEGMVRRRRTATSSFGSWQHLREHPRTAALLIGVAALGAGTDPSITLAPAMSAALGEGTALAGPFATTFGIGAGIGFPAILLARRLAGDGQYGNVGLLVMAFGTAVVGMAGNQVWAFAGFTLTGIGMTLALTGLSASLQLQSPEYLRGRIMALWGVAFLGSRPFAAAANGAVTDAFSVQAALLGTAAVLVGAALLCIISKAGEAPSPTRVGPPR